MEIASHVLDEFQGGNWTISSHLVTILLCDLQYHQIIHRNKSGIFLRLFRFIRRRKKCAFYIALKQEESGNTQCRLGDFVCSEDKWVKQAMRAGHLPVITLISEWESLPF